MASTTIKDILVAARALVAVVPLSRNASLHFLEHRSNLKFEEAPVAGKDGFEVVAQDIKLTSAFGIFGQKEGQFDMVVKLGHCPAGPDYLRENYRAQDVTRLTDIVEFATFPAGTQVVLYDRDVVNKDNPSWWMTELHFKVVYTGDLQLV